MPLSERILATFKKTELMSDICVIVFAENIKSICPLYNQEARNKGRRVKNSKFIIRCLFSLLWLFFEVLEGSDYLFEFGKFR